ncbi:hypothetical protein M426DRAFT_320132 [Hypoxylon sp. CI-4A]|nr:hypothetical protein M426DRAFT_320132 [Hypoxylon sp. CI-4A]
MGKFGSKSIAYRPGRLFPFYPPYQSPAKYWKGPFRFFDLPPELRDQILRLILLEWDSAQKDTVHLFLTCRRIYEEAASVFYYEVLLDNMHLKGTADPFLTGPLTRVSPRQYVRNLVIRFSLKEQINLFGETYGTALQEMAEKGRLQDLRLEVGSLFPNPDFWGFEDELSAYESIRVTNKAGKESFILAPLFITKAPFQNFLKFLDESKIPKITLFVDAEDHETFWCLFHRPHPSGKRCEGEWKGNSKMLKVQHSNLVKCFKGARAEKPTWIKDCNYTPIAPILRNATGNEET